jgi:hypothetical protein
LAEPEVTAGARAPPEVTAARFDESPEVNCVAALALIAATFGDPLEADCGLAAAMATGCELAVAIATAPACGSASAVA